MSHENYSSLFTSIHWQSSLPVKIAPTLCHWLSDKGSLTMRLKSCCEQFAVRQIPVQHAKPYEYEVALLGDFSHYRSREVYLQGDGIDWIFARSLWPDVAPCTVLNELANQPLGSLLFASEQKGNVARHYGYLELAEQTLWARLSIYSYRSIPVLVQELFLPESPAYRRHVNGQ